MTVFFTSDHHFGHRAIIRHANRPFAFVQEMDEIMIERWNKVVHKNDTVWHLGDFAWRDANTYLPRLNGNLHLIWGNHDRNKTRKNPRWMSNQFGIEINQGGGKIVLCHYRMMVWNRHHHGSLHLYGHSHDSLPGDVQCCDVGVDCWDFWPVTLEQIKVRLAQSEPHKWPDHHQPQTVESSLDDAADQIDEF